MKQRCVFMITVLAGILATTAARADSHELSPEKIDYFDQRGYFTPAFKAAVHDLVDAKDELKKTDEEKRKLDIQLPGQLQQADQEQAKTVALRQELDKYEHPDENDFNTLQGSLNADSGTKVEDQIAMAQAYIWTYPSSPHEPDAARALAQLQKKLADTKQADADAEAARVAAHAKMVQRAQARDLSLPEWREFLHGQSQEDLVKMLGAPGEKQDDYWFYNGEWVPNPSGHKVGMQINFEAGRVISVDLKPSTP